MTEDQSRVDGCGFPRVLPVRVVPLHPELPDAGPLDWLAGALARRLTTPVELAASLPADESWLSAGGSQLSSNRIVDSLIEEFPLPERREAERWVLAVTAADLEGGGRRFVFGEAAVGGAWAVISTARLGAPGEPLFRARLLKEALHEVGHLAGLDHCRDSACLMAASADREAVDAKGSELCAACRSRGQRGAPDRT
jgi:archaemetzincin